MLAAQTYLVYAQTNEAGQHGKPGNPVGGFVFMHMVKCLPCVSADPPPTGLQLRFTR
jgi:hypothetical protein